MNINDYLNWGTTHNEVFAVRKICVDVAGELIAGILLSQIVYWNSPDKNGNSRLKIRKNGNLCMAKKRDDWFDEVRISPKRYDRAIKVLVDKQIVKIETRKFKGSPTHHIWLNWNRFLELASQEIAKYKKCKPEKTKSESFKKENDTTEGATFNSTVQENENPSNGEIACHSGKNEDTQKGKKEIPEKDSSYNNVNVVPGEVPDKISEVILSNKREISDVVPAEFSGESSGYHPTDEAGTTKDTNSDEGSCSEGYEAGIERNIKNPSSQNSIIQHNDNFLPENRIYDDGRGNLFFIYSGGELYFRHNHVKDGKFYIEGDNLTIIAQFLNSFNFKKHHLEESMFSCKEDYEKMCNELEKENNKPKPPISEYDDIPF